jgi:hypothetical protein
LSAPDKKVGFEKIRRVRQESELLLAYFIASILSEQPV